MVSAGAEGVQTSGEGVATFLTTVGIAKVLPDLRIVARNSLYLRSLESSPSYNPDAFVTEKVVAATTTVSSIASLAPTDLAWISDERLREVVADLHAGGIAAASAKKYRVALAGFGAAYEGMIQAFVEQLDDAKREQLRLSVTLGNNQHPPRNLSKCTFEGLILIAHETGQLPRLPVDISHVARDWRNLIHADKARKDFQSESELMPEVQIMAALIVKLTQQLR